MESQIRMMKVMQPTSALPMTRNMPYASASVPSRNQPRNMTGIYLGLEGNINPPHNRGNMAVRVRKGTSAKIRTPAEDRRYKMVELLRVKEEKRGFKGQPLKRRQTPQQDEENVAPKCSHSQQLQHRKWGPAKSANPSRFDDVIRQNPRHYTAIINSGVTRSENLTGLMSFAEHYGWDISNMTLPDALIEEVSRAAAARDDMAGLEECFKKVCKGNPDSLHSLLPLRKGSSKADNFATGFTVRSYRNPNKAELLADFDVQPLQHGRPKTVPATMYSNSQNRQPMVPAPYFFKYYNTPSANSNKKRTSPTSQPEDHQSSPNGSEKIIGLPGSGVISKSLKNGRNTAWSEGDGSRIRRGTPREEAANKETERHHLQQSSRNDSLPTNSQPLEIRAEAYPLNPDDKPLASDRSGISEALSTSRSELHTSRSKSKAASNNKGESGGKGDKSEESETAHSDNNMDGRTREGGDTTIRLDLETADGKKQEIFLDDSEFTNNGKNELQRKLSEAKVASIQEGARKKKKDFEQILDEHAQIVTTISRQSSSESSNEAFQNAQSERDQ